LTGKLAPFQKFWSSRKEEARTGWRHIDGGHKRPIENHVVWMNLGGKPQENGKDVQI